MTSEQYRATLTSLGLTQVGAARFLGVDGVTSRRWATGKVPVPPTVAILFRLMVALKLSPEKVMEWLTPPPSERP